MARLYTDENFPQPVVEALRRLGHDVLTSHGAGNSGRTVPDEDVLDFAIGQGRVLLTLNRKHFIRLHRQRPEHAGTTVCAFDPDASGQAARVDAVLQREADVSGCLIRVNHA